MLFQYIRELIVRQKNNVNRWNDIVQVSQKDSIPSHFIGSIVYIEKGLYQVFSVPQLQVISGQQSLEKGK